MIYIYNIYIYDYTIFSREGCPTRGTRAACGPLDKFVRPFLLLLSFTFFSRAKNIGGRQIRARGGENFWKKGHQKN